MNANNNDASAAAQPSTQQRAPEHQQMSYLVGYVRLHGLLALLILLFLELRQRFSWDIGPLQ